ncbi:uncharacterized protein [Nicotiana sylvestris]|uniref:uncharacterized protein isoform X1 n=1 Tax=Nicotiana sylvestris TaxID=4096 RepID=UPI00388C906D
MTLERSILQYIEWKEDNGKVIFQTRAKVMSTIYTLRIDKAFNYNLISTYMVEKLNLPCVEHIDPYMLKGVKVDKRVLLPFSIGRYEDVIWCDVIPMNRFHILLGRPWNIYRSASYSIEKNRYSFEVNGKKLSLGPLTPSQICADEKIVKKNMEKYEREKNEKSKGVHVDIPREEKGEVVLSKKSGMSSEVNNDLEKKEKRESNKRNKVCKVEREKQERLSEGKELFSERKEAKGEENISLAIKAKESVSKKNVSLLPNPLTLSCFSSCDFVQPRDEIPFERSGEAQEMVAKDPIGFQHKFGNINSCWMVEDKSLIKFFVIKPFDYFDSYLQGYDMELPKSIAKVEPLHKRIQDDYLFQLGGKRHGISVKRLANELNISSYLIQVANEFSCAKECDLCYVMGSHSSSHVHCKIVKVFVSSKEDMHDCCNTGDQILFHVEESMRFVIVVSSLYHECILFVKCGKGTYIKWMCSYSLIISLSCILMDCRTDKIELQVPLHGASKRGFYCINLGRHKFYWDDDVHILYKGVFIPIRIDWVKWTHCHYLILFLLFFQISGYHLLVRVFFFLQGQNSRTNFLQEEGNDSILGSSTLFKDMDEAFESQRWPLIRVQAKELQNKIIRLQVQMKKLLIGRKSSRIKDVNWLGDSIKDKDRVLEAPRPYTRSQAKELQTKVARLQWQIKKLSIVEEELKTKGNKLSKFYNYMVVQIEVQEEEDWVTKLALEVHQKGLKISLKEVQKGVFQKEPNWSPNQWPKLVVLRPKSAPKGLGRPHLILMTFLTL